MSARPIVILGAGPAGLAAAHAASANGTPVVIVDDNPAAGGQIWRGGPGTWHDPRAITLWKALAPRTHVAWLHGARAVARAGDGSLLLDTASGAVKLACERVVVCSGAREMLLPFPGWTLPGVTGAGGLQALAKGGMPMAGKRIVVSGSGPLLLAAAQTLHGYGAHIVAIAEHRGNAHLQRFAAGLALGHPGKVLQAIRLFARLARVPYLRGATVTAAHGIEQLAAVTVSHRGVDRLVDCDYLACGFGLVPAVESASLFGCVLDGGRVMVDAGQRTSVPGVWAAGEVTGIGGVDKALAEGRIAGLNAAGQSVDAADGRALRSAQRFAKLLAAHFGPTPAMRAVCQPSTMVCRCEDVRASQLAAHADWRTAKLQTRVGMGPCQGRVCAPACGYLFGWDAPASATPAFPVSAEVLATLAVADKDSEK